MGAAGLVPKHGSQKERARHLDCHTSVIFLVGAGNTAHGLLVYQPALRPEATLKPVAGSTVMEP